MAVSLPSSQEDGKYTINIINSKIETLVIGDGNVLNNYCRCLQYPEHSAGYRSGRTTTRRTATYHDGGERRRIKRKQTKLRFPQRKYIGDSKFPSKNISDESDEDSSYGHCGPEIFPSVSGERDCAFERSIKRFHIILNRLHPLRDSGNFGDFTSVADGMLMSSKGDLELELLILLEKSVIVSYQNDLENAESMVLEVLRKLKNSKTKVEMRDYLVTMAHVYLTGTYRRQYKHGKADSTIAVAEQVLPKSQNETARFVKALILYEMASNLTIYINSVPLHLSARRKLVERSKHYMRQCIDLSIELDGGSLYIKKHHFGLLKLASLDLNCGTRAAREQITSDKCIADAQNCLRAVQEKYEDEMSEGQKIQFLGAKSDLNYRLGDLDAAQSEASQALSLAETLGFNLEIIPIRERLEDISKLITSTEMMSLEPSYEGCVNSLSSSTVPSERNSPSSSGCEME
ncbi:uncharacterized protein LOC111334580 [Stylophora pistillata]|uniref:uncharacterized protein LOC111334580 n=1 Tax=Stylophora pistillata TaxID=50429 RepID=UPI000C04963A|nr:uncharacterized protein LOC111334580 [Stylophora pistillata]